MDWLDLRVCSTTGAHFVVFEAQKQTNICSYSSELAMRINARVSGRVADGGWLFDGMLVGVGCGRERPLVAG